VGSNPTLSASQLGSPQILGAKTLELRLFCQDFRAGESTRAGQAALDGRGDGIFLRNLYTTVVGMVLEIHGPLWVLSQVISNPSPSGESHRFPDYHGRLYYAWSQSTAAFKSQNAAEKHSAAQVAEIAGSIRTFGFTNPLLVGEDADVVAGTVVLPPRGCSASQRSR
jgi:hypothetical protein